MLTHIFMTRDEQINCTFEPNVGRLNTLSKRADRGAMTKQPDEVDEPDQKTYAMRQGLNFEKSHPIIHKTGKLKKAQLEFQRGNIGQCETVLSEGFNLESLRKKFDPGFHKRQAALAMKKMMQAIKEGKRKKVEGTGKEESLFATLKRD